MKPLIGILMRNWKSASGKDIQFVYDDIFKVIIKSGGIPLGIANDKLDMYLDICQGYIIQGGDEFSMIDMNNIAVIKKLDLPLLGICLGMQEMAYSDKGTIKDIANHKDTEHAIIIKNDSLLYKIIGKEKMLVNSRHKSAIMQTSLTVSAYAPDHVIEAVEDEQCKFFLGVQWHPEGMYDTSIDNQKIFDYFVKICHD